MSLQTQIKNASLLDEPWLHTFLYGPPGSGKTTAAATWPRPLFLVPANEHSITTLAGMDVSYIEITGQRGPVNAGRGGLDGALQLIEQSYRADPDAFPYDTVVIESLSHYVDLVQEELTQSGAKPMDQRGWGLLAQHIRNVQVRLRNLQVHVVFTALDKVEQDAAGVASGGPLLPGASAVKVPSACDIIGYCEPGGKNRPYRVHFERFGHFPARTRFRTLPKIVEDFSFEKIKGFVHRNLETATVHNVSGN